MVSRGLFKGFKKWPIGTPNLISFNCSKNHLIGYKLIWFFCFWVWHYPNKYSLFIFGVKGCLTKKPNMCQRQICVRHDRSCCKIEMLARIFTTCYLQQTQELIFFFWPKVFKKYTGFMASLDRQRKSNELDLHNHCKKRMQSAEQNSYT